MGAKLAITRLHLPKLSEPPAADAVGSNGRFAGMATTVMG